jgi:HSP20 family protein
MAQLATQRGSSARPVQRFAPINDVEQLVEQLLSPTGLADPRLWTPPVDIEETEDAWIVEAELPGAKDADINVDVDDDELRVSGEIKERERTGILRRRTRRTGEFELRVSLPSDADTDGVKADLADGVLTVRIPRQEAARARRIEVSSGSASGNGSKSS